MKITKGLLISLLIISLLIGVALGTIMFTLPVTQKMSVAVTWGIQLWNVAKTAEVTEINWGTFTKGQTSGDKEFYVKSIANKEQHVSFNTLDLDTTKWTFSAKYGEIDAKTWVQGKTFPLPRDGYMKIWINLKNIMTVEEPADYTWTLELNAHDTAIV